MDYIVIEVPDMNDSISRIVLNGKPYYIRFSYNDTKDYWKFGLYDSQKNPIVLGIKIVPMFPLNIFACSKNMPDGVFATITELERIGRKDFVNKNAQFVFCPVTIK